MFGRKRLLEENKALKKQIELLMEPERLEAEFTKNGAMVKIEHWAVRLLAASLMRSLHDAPNFVTMDVADTEGRTLTVTVQRKHGKSPAELLAELRQKLKENGIPE